MKKRNIFFLIFIVLLVIVGYGYYKMKPGSSKIGEVSFYKGADMELKVVLTYENLPFHYVGNHYSVACQSENTQDFLEWEWDKIEKGWNRVPDAVLGDGTETDKNLLLESLANEAKKLYLIKDKMTLVILASPHVYVSFDGCRTFTDWSLKDDLPADLIVEPTPEFEKCMEQQKKEKEAGLASYGDCFYQKFTSKNKPNFQDVVASSKGYLSFKVASAAFKNNEIIEIETSDSGKTWRYTKFKSILNAAAGINIVNLPVEIRSNVVFKDWYKTKQERYTDINSFSLYLIANHIAINKQTPYDGGTVCIGQKSRSSPSGNKIACISAGVKSGSDLLIYDKIKKISGRLESCPGCSDEDGFWLDGDQFIFLSSYKDDEMQVYKEFIVVQQFDFGKDRSDSWSAGVK